MIDRYTKVVLTVIAAGLWVSLLAPKVKITPAAAQDTASYLRSIDNNISILVGGVCVNRKLC